MKALGDGVVAHLRCVVDEPDLSGTKYRFVGPLGRGGMASVWEAEDTELGRSVAIKVSSDAVRAEARVLASLEHPGIVPVHDVGTLPDGRVFYVMKLVRGERLDDWLAKEPRPPRTAVLRVFEKICEAVAFAHAAGVIHRDLKPENVMIGEFGEALVLDWGIEGIAGTPAYMAPEQHERAALDAKTDIFCLGATLYFILAGHAPFDGRRARSAERTESRLGGVGGRSTLTAREAPPLEGVPAPLASICATAMAAAPRDRYMSATMLAADVGRFLDGDAPRAHRETPLERVARFASRHRVVLTLLATYLVIRLLLALFPP
jgi:serine/threonine protein kinase